jgi:hypothetical protein
MTMSAFFAAVARNLLGSAWVPLARGAWCRKQRRLLGASGHTVVWVRGDALSWAEWGARRGYFEVLHMNGLPYLRALGAPLA